jgi:hypothetical protein
VYTYWGTCKVRSKTKSKRSETERNQTKRSETKRNRLKRSETSFRFAWFRFVSFDFVSFGFVSISFRTLQVPYILWLFVLPTYGTWIKVYDKKSQDKKSQSIFFTLADKKSQLIFLFNMYVGRTRSHNIYIYKCSNDSWAIFTKILKITIDRKLYWIVHFYLDLFVPHQNDVATTKIMK